MYPPMVPFAPLPRGSRRPTRSRSQTAKIVAARSSRGVEMVVGSGIDIVEVGRVQKTLRRFGRRFEERTFSAQEIAACRGCPRRVPCLAARFAAKEATMKALGTGWRRGVRFRDIEVEVGPGRPERLRLCGRAAEIARDRGAERWHVALSTGREVAVAVVLLETERASGEGG